MKKLLIAAGVLVLAAAMCVPVTVFSDGSDAFEIKESENGISWESDTLNEEQVNKLYTQDQLDDLAGEAAELVLYDSYKFTFSNVKVTEAEVKVAQGKKVTSEEMTYIMDNSVKAKLTFRATAKSSDDRLFSDMADNVDLIRFVKFDNRTVSGMYLDFDVEFEMVLTEKSVNGYVQNKAGNYVVVKEDRDMMESRSVNGNVKCCYNDGTADVTKEFTVDMSSEYGTKGAHTEYEFNGDPADAKEGDRVLCKEQDAGDITYVFKSKYEVDGTSGGGEYDLSAMMEVESGSATASATVYEADDLEPVTYEFYPTGGTATPLFYSVNDPALASNDALKTYLNEHGSTGETFSSAEDLADSEYGSSAKKSHTMLYVGIGVGVVAVVAIGAFVFFRMRA